MNALYVTDASDSTLQYIPEENQSEWDTLDQEWMTVREYTNGLEEDLNRRLANKAAEEAAKIALDEQRRADEAAEAARVQAE
jgi:hypothetical protein